MNKRITINFTIPLSDKEWAGPCIIFDQWIPETESDAIVVNYGDKEVRLYIDKSCVSSLRDVTDKLISSWRNISVSKLIVEVILSGVEDEFLNFIYEEREKVQRKFTTA